MTEDALRNAAEPQEAIGYVRCSAKGQLTDGFGIEDQTWVIQETCRRSGFRLVKIYADQAEVDVALDQRPGFSAALAAIRPGMVFVVARMDRLARQLFVQETAIGMLRKTGSDLWTCDPGEASLINGDTTDPVRVAVRQILGAIAELERARIVGRLAAGQRAKKRAGNYAGGAVPFGAQVIGRGKHSKLAPDPKKAAAIDRICQLREKGLSYRAIAMRMDQLGYDAPTSGKGWSYKTVARIIAREMPKRIRIEAEEAS